MNRKILKIGNRIVSDKHHPLIIAEIGQTHNGSIEKAFKFIDKIKLAGGDAVKFQLHIASEESTLDEPFRVKIENFKSRYDYWKSVEFTNEEWFKISKYCKKKKIIFLSSVFSKKGIEILKKAKISAWKVASGEFNSKYILDEMINSRLPILFSTGMMNLTEIQKIHQKLNNKSANHAILQCTSNYPVKLQNTGINVIKEFRKKFNCQIGYSDHSGSIVPPFMALASNSNLVEVHVKLDTKDKGPDSTSSLNLIQFKDLCEMRDQVHIINTNPVDKNIISKDLIKMRNLFGKSIALKFDLKKGSIIKKSDLTMKKPGFGFKENQIKYIVGRRLIKNVTSKRILKKKDLL